MGMSSYEQARLEEHLAPILASAAAAAVVEPPKSTVKTHLGGRPTGSARRGRGRGDRPIDFDQHVPGLGAAAPAADDARAADPAARPSPADVTQYPPPASPAASERSDWDESVDAAELAKLMHHGATPAVDERERERERGGAAEASAAGGRASSPPPRGAAEADGGAYAVVDLERRSRAPTATRRPRPTSPTASSTTPTARPTARATAAGSRSPRSSAGTTPRRAASAEVRRRAQREERDHRAAKGAPCDDGRRGGHTSASSRARGLLGGSVLRTTRGRSNTVLSGVRAGSGSAPGGQPRIPTRGPSPGPFPTTRSCSSPCSLCARGARATRTRVDDGSPTLAAASSFACRRSSPCTPPRCARIAVAVAEPARRMSTPACASRTRRARARVTRLKTAKVDRRRDRATASERTHLGDLLDVGARDAAVDLEADVEARVVDHLARLARLVERARDERLAAEAGVDRHEQDDVDLVHHVPDEREILRDENRARGRVGVLEAVERRRGLKASRSCSPSSG